MSAAPHPLQLHPHPATPCAAVRAVEARVASDPVNGCLRIAFVLTGDVTRLRIPAAATTPGPRDGLWRHTCFEVFASPADAPHYREFNFSPSGHWAAYAFSAERVRVPLPVPAPAAPRIACQHGAHALTLQALLPLAWLPTARGPLCLGLAAVVEAADGTLSYWALAHPAAQADFHQRAGWSAHVVVQR